MDCQGHTPFFFFFFFFFTTEPCYTLFASIVGDEDTISSYYRVFLYFIRKACQRQPDIFSYTLNSQGQDGHICTNENEMEGDFTAKNKCLFTYQNVHVIKRVSPISVCVIRLVNMHTISLCFKCAVHLVKNQWCD